MFETHSPLSFVHFPAPEYIRLPEANQTGDVVIVDWSKSFKLNGPLFEYILYENDFLIFRGTSSYSGRLTGRVGEGKQEQLFLDIGQIIKIFLSLNRSSIRITRISTHMFPGFI